jgi:hypothetical protein
MILHAFCSETSHNFTDGNLPTMLKMFLSKHKCKDFCKFFGLPALLANQSPSYSRTGGSAIESSYRKIPLFADVSKSLPPTAYNLDGTADMQITGQGY